MNREDTAFCAKEVQTLLDNNLVEPCRSEWAQPVVVAKRRIGDEIVRRLCVDYRKVNEACVGDSFPMQSVDNVLR
jgi:hypothetical protein